MVFLSIIPYAIRVYERKIQPVSTSWSLCSLIGFAVLLTYRSSGAEANVWPAVFGFVNPTLITILSVWRHGEWKKPTLADRFCFLFGVASLAMDVLPGNRRVLAMILAHWPDAAVGQNPDSVDIRVPLPIDTPVRTLAAVGG